MSEPIMKRQEQREKEKSGRPTGKHSQKGVRIKLQNSKLGNKTLDILKPELK